MPGRHDRFDPHFPSLPAVDGKKVRVASFDSSRISSDGGALLLATPQAKAMCAKLTALVPDGRDPTNIRHEIADMFLARTIAIAAGCADADDLDALRHDPAFNMAVGKRPDADVGLASRPTVSHLENAPVLRAVIRMTHAMVKALVAARDTRLLQKGMFRSMLKFEAGWRCFP